MPIEEQNQDQRFEPPWYGYPPRIVSVSINGKIEVAIWKEGIFTEILEIGNAVTSGIDLLRIGEEFREILSERYMFGARLAIGNYLDGTPFESAVYAIMLQDAEWAGLILSTEVEKLDVRKTASVLAKRLGYEYNVCGSKIAQRGGKDEEKDNSKDMPDLQSGNDARNTTRQER